MPLRYIERRYGTLAENNRKILTLLIMISCVGTSYYLTSILQSRNRPMFYLNDFHVSSLNTTTRHSVSNTTTIYFDLNIQNKNSIVGIYYNDPLKLTFTYFPPSLTPNTNVTIGEYTVQGFYQGNGKTKHVRDFVVVRDLFSEAEHGRELGETYVPVFGPVKVVAFKVDLNAKIKFKSIETQKYSVFVTAMVDVNGNTGDFLQKKTTEMEYASAQGGLGFIHGLLSFVLFCVFLGSSCPCCLGLSVSIIRDNNWLPYFLDG